MTRVCLIGLLLLAGAAPACAYSLLTHEQLIDLSWERSIVPLLKSRYPTLTPAQLEHARAYAYGGCAIQDIGYYPFGDRFFSDLTHYVRSGDFVVNLFRNAGNADELAFAVGALSHYIGDSVGHAEATNLAVPVEFPKLRKKYGPVVSYAEGEHQHVQTEFAFDIDEIAHHRLAPVHYLRHVGLEVPTQQVALAFYQTYGLREDFSRARGRRINVGAYRFAVHRFIPRIAYAINLLHRGAEPPVVEDAELKRLESEIAVVEARNNWATYRRQPGMGTYLLAGLIYVTPKLGPLKLAAVKGPDTKTEAEYVHSVLDSTDALDRALHRFTPPPPVRSSAAFAAAADIHAEPQHELALENPASAARVGLIHPVDPLHPLPNRDLDTGNPARPGGYRLTDETFAALVHRLAATPAVPIPPGVKSEILGYYSNMDVNFATRKDPAAWATLLKDLDTLRAMPTSREQDPFATYSDAGAGS